MHPLRESSEADALYGPFMWGDVDLYEQLLGLGEQVRLIVPSCVGLSVSLRDHDVTLTLVASDDTIARLDAVQYVDGGPCVDALASRRAVAADQRSMEELWELFAQASRNNGVESSLSLPVPWEGSSALGFNLYASTSGAFDGHHDELAAVLGAWADGAVTDRDLAFTTADLARQAPSILKQATDLALVAALLAKARGLTHDEAAQRLRGAALRAAIPLADLLGIMREVLPEPRPDPDA